MQKAISSDIQRFSLNDGPEFGQLFFSKDVRYPAVRSNPESQRRRPVVLYNAAKCSRNGVKRLVKAML